MSHKDIIKKYGEGVLMDASFLAEEERMVIPISPALNIPLRGGIHEGCVCTFSGKEGSGKSTTALQVASYAQKPEYGSRKVFYDDVEHRLKRSNLEGIHGLIWKDKEKFEIIHSTKETILHAADHLNIMLELMKSYPKSVFIIDSTSALCGEDEAKEDVKSDFRNGSPKLLANFCRHIAPIVQINKQIVILTQHMIADTSGRSMGSGYHEDGGAKIKHQSDVRMRIKYTENWEVGSGENTHRVGKLLNWQIIKSPYGEFDKIQSYLRYGYGLDDITETINLACDIGLIVKGGSWYTLGYLETPVKLQGGEKVYEHMVANKIDYDKLYKLVMESLK